MRRKFAPLLLLILFALCPLAGAQTPTLVKPQPTPTPQPAQTPAPAPPAANPADVDTLDHIVAALYDVISGPAGKKRDWDRMRSLFAGGARMMPTGPRRAPGSSPDAPLTGKEEYAVRVLTVEDYIVRSGPYLEGNGFFERESARRTEAYGHIAQVFSTYESRHKAEDPQPFQRGINGIQLFNDGKRWWILSIFWEGETNVTPLPEKYLKSAP